jgi:NAD(P)-dependent dehydrogenase (short-subunit alcohol dehydrogenase family)
MSEKPRALVTGVGKKTGLGYAVCRELVDQGFDVIATARTLSKVEAVIADLDGVSGMELDIENPASVAQAAASIDRLDVLVNNAAILGTSGVKASNADLDEARSVFEAGFFGTWRVTQAFLPLLLASPAGRVVNVSSGAGSHADMQFGLSVGGYLNPAYGQMKAALNALTAQFAVEVRGTQVKVNSVCPGFTATFEGGEAMGARPPAVSAKGIVWAATLPSDGPSGGFFRDGKPIGW